MKKFLYENKIIVLFVLIACMFLILSGCSNKQYFDTTYNFNYAKINTFDDVIEGKVTSWTDFEDGDQLQVTIDGVTYLTSATNVILEHR